MSMMLYSSCMKQSPQTDTLVLGFGESCNIIFLPLFHPEKKLLYTVGAKCGAAIIRLYYLFHLLGCIICNYVEKYVKF